MTKRHTLEARSRKNIFMKYPLSPKVETEGLVYFARLCDKVRLHEAGELPESYHANLGRAMDLWTCQLLGVEYDELAEQVKKGASDADALQWAFEKGQKPSEVQVEWWNSYMRNRGLRDNLAERLAARIEEDGLHDKEILSFFDYIDVDEGRA